MRTIFGTIALALATMQTWTPAVTGVELPKKPERRDINKCEPEKIDACKDVCKAKQHTFRPTM